MAEKKTEKENAPDPRLPTIAEDGTWTREVWGQTLRFREIKLRERSLASNQARAVAPNAPGFEEDARAFAMTVRRQLDGVWEELPYGEIMEKGETYLYELQETYQNGIIALKIQVKKSSKTSKPAAAIPASAS